MCGCKGAEFIANAKARIFSPALSNSVVRWGGDRKKPGPAGNEPEAWVYFGQKGLVPTFAAHPP
jgi:hypothetical protein